MLFYLPLERYGSRYTYQLSAPKTGWLERQWIRHCVNYHRVDGYTAPQQIKTGVALDAARRSIHCFKQVETLLKYASNKSSQGLKLTSDDVIYLDDFWTPGIEAIPYYFSLQGQPCPRIYANLWAQSVDRFDFTYQMREWIRSIEKGYGSFYSGIFVACPMLQKLVSQPDSLQTMPIAPPYKVHAVGHPWSTEEVMERMPQYYQNEILHTQSTDSLRLKKIVYSSRLDKEKNPEFFIKVVHEVLKRDEEAFFVICAGTELRSNMPGIVEKVKSLHTQYGNRCHILENLTKEQYYTELTTSRVQLNTAYQDWISFTLLEASVAGCYPVYPNFRSFPEVLRFNSNFLYESFDSAACATKVVEALNLPIETWKYKAIKEREWIHTRFDDTWFRMLKIMGILDGEVSDAFEQ